MSHQEQEEEEEEEQEEPHLILPAYFCILLHTFAYFCILLHTFAYSTFSLLRTSFSNMPGKKSTPTGMQTCTKNRQEKAVPARADLSLKDHNGRSLKTASGG